MPASLIAAGGDGYRCPMSGKGPAKGSPPKRQYRMRARARSTEATRETILDAVEVAFEELLFDEITLEAIAERSGVSVQTILRHFGSKEGLYAASMLHVGN